MTLFLGYTRVSTGDQAEHGHSLEGQRRELMAFFERQGWQYEIREDAGLSGESIEGRPEMQRILRDVAAGGVGGVFAVHIDRFSRNLGDLLRIVDVFRAAGVKYGTPSEILDPGNPHQRLQTHVRGSFAEYENALRVERTLRGKLAKAHRGHWPAGRVSYGLRKMGDLVAVDEAEARVIRQIRDMVLVRGMGARAIGRELEALGIPNPHGGRHWARSTVRKIIMNMVTVYTGRAFYNTLKRHGTTLRPRPDGERIPVAFPRIISDEDALQVQERFRKISALSEGKTRHRYLLRGLAFCECGRRLGACPIHGVAYYRCSGKDRSISDPPCPSRSVPAARVETLAWTQVVALFRDPAAILEQARMWRESRVTDRDELEMRVANLDASLQKIPDERQRIITGYREGWIAKDDAKRQLRELDRKRERLEDERRQIAARLSVEQADEAQTARLEAIAQRVGRRLNRLSWDERFDLVQSFVEKVTVFKDGRVEIRAFVPIPERGAIRATTC